MSAILSFSVIADIYFIYYLPVIIYVEIIHIFYGCNKNEKPWEAFNPYISSNRSLSQHIMIYVIELPKPA